MTRLELLFEKYLQKSCTSQEKAELFDLISMSEHDEAVKALIDDAIRLSEEEVLLSAQKSDEILSLIISAGKPVPVVVKMQRRRIIRWVAAATIVLVAGSALLFRNNNNQKNTIAFHQPSMKIPPGHDGAILTLADGSTVQLDSLGNGLIAMQQGRQVIMNNGEITYKGQANHNSVALNRIHTPRGRQFRLELPDGSKVWLNAASSITYPTAFNGRDRQVEVTGEVYLEVAPQAEKPFIVKIDSSTSIEVLGTAFNINSYTDESARAITLLGGSIRVNTAGKDVVLRPGQQALAGTGPLVVTNNIDVDQVMAWKNGSFNFNGMDLPSVLRQLSRWYDVDIVYEGKIPDRTFGGEIQRDLSLEQVLRILGKMHVEFEITKDKQLIVR